MRILRYLKGTRSLSLVLGCDQSPSLIGYSDSNYTNCLNTSHSISGHCHSLGSGVISWSSKKQKVMANSSYYTEYITLHNTSHETVFLCQLLEGIGLTQTNPTPLHCNNNTVSCLAEDHIWRSSTCQQTHSTPNTHFPWTISPCLLILYYYNTLTMIPSI